MVHALEKSCACLGLLGILEEFSDVQSRGVPRGGELYKEHRPACLGSDPGSGLNEPHDLRQVPSLQRFLSLYSCEVGKIISTSLAGLS